MNKGRCLCGSVTWELLGEPFQAFNCHCRQCQRVHGTAFGTYYFLKSEHLRWTSSTDTVVHYRSSERLVRSSCDTCGSVVPYTSGAGENWVAPAGCHDDGRKADHNIFVVNASPWHEVTGDLPRHDAYPDYTGYPSVDTEDRPERTEHGIRGSCECGTVVYEVVEPFRHAYFCHCSRCRHARAAAHASNGFTSLDGVRFLQGEDNLKSYKVPDARYFTQVFCKTCSSPMPRRNPEFKVTTVPLGSLDGDPGFTPKCHIFVAHKAGWHEITDDLPQYDEGPPPA